MNLNKIAKQLVATPKGILAADESTPNMNKRLAKVGVEGTEETRRKFREILITTKGLKGLAERLEEYKTMGAVFTKWRSVIRIGQNMPSKACLEANADGLAQYASVVQKAGLVPILEPEVLLDGDHSLEQAENVTTETLKTVFAACKKQKVDLTGLLLKSSMVLPGSESAQK